MGDFQPKERGPVSWLPGGSRLCPLLQLAANWEVLLPGMYTPTGTENKTDANSVGSGSRQSQLHETASQ
uniref:Uncharacterized protein n=1 Tax=Hyaloperonospora arabidopsidis (strain Emoy2) TaxID=559515 RepID=M4B416_HYAAE